jgi:hypothetical protein
MPEELSSMQYTIPELFSDMKIGCNSQISVKLATSPFTIIILRNE